MSNAFPVAAADDHRSVDAKRQEATAAQTRTLTIA
jgi:hypothetical protein